MISYLYLSLVLFFRMERNERGSTESFSGVRVCSFTKHFQFAVPLDFHDIQKSLPLWVIFHSLASHFKAKCNYAWRSTILSLGDMTKGRSCCFEFML